MRKLNAILATIPAIEVIIAEVLGVRGVEIILDIDEKDLDNESLQESTQEGLHYSRDV